MTTGIASGLGATWGLAQETTVGTYIPPTRWIPVISDKMKGAKKTVQSQALHGGLYELASRRRLVFHEAKGPVEFDVQDKQLGILLKNMIGSNATATQQGASTAYLQVHSPGDLMGMSLSLQSGRPQINGTIQPFSYNGCKILDWELSVAAGGIAKLVCTFDGMDESTASAYTAPSYITSHPLAWVDANLLLGGTVTNTSGTLGVTAGAQPLGTVKSVSIKGSNASATDRQQIGSLTKREQLANAFRKYTGQMVVEFANLTDMYNAYYADTGMALQLTMQGSLIASTYYNQLNTICPMVFFDGEPPEVDGTKIIEVTVPFSILDDGTNPQIQFQYQSTDTAV